MMSGSRRTISCGVGDDAVLSPGLQRAARERHRRRRRCRPARETQRMPLIIGSSHSSKYTRGRRGKRAAAAADLVAGRARRCRHQTRAFVGRADQRAEPAGHVEDLLDAALVEDRHLHARPHQLAPRCRPAGRRSRTRSRAAARGSGRSSRERRRRPCGFSRARARRPHGVAGDADDARLLAQQVQPLGRSPRSGRRCVSGVTCGH